MRRFVPVLLVLSLILNLLLLFHFRLELFQNLSIPNPSRLIAEGRTLISLHQYDSSSLPLKIPESQWSPGIRALKPSQVWLDGNGLMIQTFGCGLTRDGGVTITNDRRRPSDATLYFYDTWYPGLFRWETVINE